jgi:hypothetical protein
MHNYTHNYGYYQSFRENTYQTYSIRNKKTIASPRVIAEAVHSLPRGAALVLPPSKP